MPAQPELREHLLELIRLAATDLPRGRGGRAAPGGTNSEAAGSAARERAGSVILEERANWRAPNATPICQDTGTPIFYVYLSGGAGRTLAGYARTDPGRGRRGDRPRSYLRPNAVETHQRQEHGQQPGGGLLPLLSTSKEVGRGCPDRGPDAQGGRLRERRRAVYALPDTRLGADRDLEGVRRAVLDAVHQAQGLGCAPAVIGVAIGGDRASSYIKSKEQFYRPLDDASPDPKIAALEKAPDRRS
jgi:fumarate hydratase class I